MGKLVFVGEGSEWFWQVFQLIVLVVTGALIYRQIRLQRHTHLVGSFSTLYAKWNSSSLLRARYQVCKGYAPDLTYVDFHAHQVAMFFEELGLYSNNSVLDEKVVWELYSFEVEHYWPILRNRIVSLRDLRRDKTFFWNFENLHGKMADISTRMNAQTVQKTDALLKDFIDFELDIVEGHAKVPIARRTGGVKTPKGPAESGDPVRTDPRS